jgi:hypothetical protein
MKKSELTTFIKEEILSTLNESPSSEEIRMAKQAVNRFMKYRNVEQDEAIRDLKNALDVLKSSMEEAINTEGVWSKGDDTAIRDFILDVKQLKDDYYNIVGSDDVFNGLDAAIRAANELIAMKEATYKVSADKVDSIKNKVSDEDTVEVTEEDDKEPSKADLKATKSLAKAKEELAQLTIQMKSLARDYKKAEGEEKEKLVADLKKKTKLKKELEAIIDK